MAAVASMTEGGATAIECAARGSVDGLRIIPPDEAVEDFKQCIDDRLSERIRGVGNVFVLGIASGQGEISALIGHDRSGALDGPLGKVTST